MRLITSFRAFTYTALAGGLLLTTSCKKNDEAATTTTKDLVSAQDSGQ